MHFSHHFTKFLYIQLSLWTWILSLMYHSLCLVFLSITTSQTFTALYIAFLVHIHQVFSCRISSLLTSILWPYMPVWYVAHAAGIPICYPDITIVTCFSSRSQTHHPTIWLCKYSFSLSLQIFLLQLLMQLVFLQSFIAFFNCCCCYYCITCNWYSLILWLLSLLLLLQVSFLNIRYCYSYYCI